MLPFRLFSSIPAVPPNLTQNKPNFRPPDYTETDPAILYPVKYQLRDLSNGPDRFPHFDSPNKSPLYDSFFLHPQYRLYRWIIGFFGGSILLYNFFELYTQHQMKYDSDDTLSHSIFVSIYGEKLALDHINRTKQEKFKSDDSHLLDPKLKNQWNQDNH